MVSRKSYFEDVNLPSLPRLGLPIYVCINVLFLRRQQVRHLLAVEVTLTTRVLLQSIQVTSLPRLVRVGSFSSVSLMSLYFFILMSRT